MNLMITKCEFLILILHSIPEVMINDLLDERRSLSNFPEGSKYFLCPHDPTCGDVKFDSYQDFLISINKTNVPAGGFWMIKVQNQAFNTNKVQFLAPRTSFVKATAYKINEVDGIEYLGPIDTDQDKLELDVNMSESIWIMLENQNKTKVGTFQAEIVSDLNSSDKDFAGIMSMKTFFIIIGWLGAVCLICSILSTVFYHTWGPRYRAVADRIDRAAHEQRMRNEGHYYPPPNHMYRNNRYYNHQESAPAPQVIVVQPSNQPVQFKPMHGRKNEESKT